MDLRGPVRKLVARTWDCTEAADHVVVIAHGYGEDIGRYERIAQALVANGAVVYAVDHAGHGKSDGDRVLIGDFEDIVSDLRALHETARLEHPDLPAVLLGHSMGGMIAARYAQRYGDVLEVLVLSSPVIGSWRAVTDLLSLDEMPDAPLDVSTLSRDPAVGARYNEDPLIWHGPFKRATVESFKRTLATISEGPSVDDLPLIWVHGDDDQLVPLEASREGVHHLRGRTYEERIYPDGRHELFNETNADEVLAEVTALIRGPTK